MTGQLPPPAPPLRIDNSHVSSHFLKGQYDYPITQKVTSGGKSIHLDTPVDGQGNVGETQINLPTKK